MSVQSINGLYNPYHYGQSFGANNVPVSVQKPVEEVNLKQPIIPEEEIPVLPDAPQEDPSLMEQCAFNVGLFGGIKGIQYGRHPINTIKGAINAGKTYAENAEALKGLSAIKQGEVYGNLFTAARLEPRFANNSAEFTRKLTELRNNYINALKAGTEPEIAKAGAELTTFANRSKKGLINGAKNMYYNFRNPLQVAEGTGFWGRAANRVKGTFRGPSVDMAMEPALKSGETAAKLATEANAAKTTIEGATKFQKVVGTGKQWFKQGGGWICVALETAGQAPELIAAYSEGEKGDGLKQTAKSAVTVATNTAGWIVGAKAGSLCGAKIGGAIGSLFPGAGTAIGAGIGGFLGGLVGMAVGSWGASKASKAICGKSFTEERAEKMAKQQQAAQQMILSQQKFNPNYATNPFYNQGYKIR